MLGVLLSYIYVCIYVQCYLVDVFTLIPYLYLLFYTVVVVVVTTGQVIRSYVHLCLCVYIYMYITYFLWVAASNVKIAMSLRKVVIVEVVLYRAYIQEHLSQDPGCQCSCFRFAQSVVLELAVLLAMLPVCSSLIVR